MANDFIVIYGKVTEDKEDGIFFHYPFFGGETDSLQKAEQIARTLVNDKTKQAIVIPHIFHMKRGEDLSDIMEQAKKRFRRMEADMYECEEMYEKRSNRD